MEGIISSISVGYKTLTSWKDGTYTLNDDQTGEYIDFSEENIVDVLNFLWEEYH